MSIKRYYWLKLPKDFFTDVVIKKLKKKERGYVYIVIYTELLLLSLEDEGYLFFETVEDNFNEELALRIDEDPTDIKTTIEYLIDKRLLEVKADDEYFLNRMPEMIGSESDSAKRVRKHRLREKALQCNTDVTKCNTEIDKEIKDIIRVKNKIDTDGVKTNEETLFIKNSFNEVLKNQASLSIILNLIDRIGLDRTYELLEQVKQSEWLKLNIKLQTIKDDDFLLKVLEGEYYSYTDCKNPNKEEYEDDFECWQGITDKEILL